jgi:ribulose-phosphate 3-epimerase
LKINAMDVIPGINCSDYACVTEHLAGVRSLGVPWVHIDVADGAFAPVTTWNEPSKLVGVPHPFVEVHLMVEDPGRHIERWRGVGKRFVVHVEVVSASHFQFPASEEMGLALLPDTPVEEVYPYLDRVRFVQFLAVPPGFSGQKFDERILEKIRVLKKHDPDVVVEVDGGIEPRTAQQVGDAGADMVVSTSYIWNSEDPEAALRRLGVVI